MSSRLVKKILKAQENALQQQQQDNEDESESPDASPPSQNNPFELLDEEDYEEKEQTDNYDGINQVDTIEVTDRPSIEKNDEKHSSKGAKKKKNKSKKKVHTATENPQKSLDEALENVSIEGNSSSPELASHLRQAILSKRSGTKKSSVSILQIDPKFLSAENELRRIFGSKVVSSFERNSQSVSYRQGHGNRRGASNHRKTILVHPSEAWPRWDGSLTMELLGTENEINYFRYVHSASYSQAQRAFEAAKAIHDLNGIVNVLLRNPYHIDSLITLADYYKFSGELQMSSDAIARCLYAMECAWHPMFNPLLGKSQLKFIHETNKPFFSALFSHMKNMDRRGCHRSALEICKWLLSLDSDDPVGALFCLDYYALRAEEYSWLEHFSEEYKTDNSLWLFPNFSYSLAICRFKLENQENKDLTKAESLKAESTDLMKQALMLHPTVLKKLVAKVPLKDQAFARIIGHRLFASEKSGSLSLDHLVNIYVERNYLIWRLPDIQKFLKDSALLVIEMLDRKETDAKDWACVRKEAFSSDKNEYSHLLVSEFSDSVPTLPPDNLQNFMVDPRLVNNNGGEQAGANRPVRDLSNRNAIAVLLESMLPWADFGTEHAVEDQPHGHEG